MLFSQRQADLREQRALQPVPSPAQARQMARIIAIYRENRRQAPRPTFPYWRPEMESITLTKDQLRAALAQWERDARDGKTITAADAASLPLDEVVNASTDTLWEALKQPQPAA